MLKWGTPGADEEWSVWLSSDAAEQLTRLAQTKTAKWPLGRSRGLTLAQILEETLSP